MNKQEAIKMANQYQYLKGRDFDKESALKITHVIPLPKVRNENTVNLFQDNLYRSSNVDAAIAQCAESEYVVIAAHYDRYRNTLLTLPLDQFLDELGNTEK